IGVRAPDIDVNLAGEFRTQRGPVALDDMREVVMIAPIRGDVFADRAADLVEDRFWIAVAARGREHRLPDVELPAGARVIALSEFGVIRVALRLVDDAVVVAD